MNFSSMKLSVKLTLGFAFVVVFAIITGAVGITQMKTIATADEKLFENGTLPLGDMIDVATGFQRIRVNLRDIARTSDADRISDLEKRIETIDNEMDESLSLVEKTIMTEEGKRAFAGLKKDQDEFMAIGRKMLKLAKDGKKNDLYEVMDGEGFKANKSFQDALDSLVENKKNAAKGLAEGNAKIATSSTLFVTIFLAIGSIIAFIIALTITKSITTALSRISENLGDASGQVASAADQLSGASQTLSNASSEQASSIEETSASLEEMNGMIENNLKNAEKAKELADSVRGIADKGNESMSELIRSMQEILEANTNIEKLVKVIGEIGDKTKVIDEIVFQTKLLSFNASVEAERAGEHGRGFAVVAQEVGNLAQMSGKAALEISGIVKESIKNAEQITTDNKKKVEKGNDLVKSTAVLLKETTEKSITVSGSATQVVDASKEQAAGIRQISNAMDQLNKATQQNAATAEEAASSSEELAAQAETMNALVGELNELVQGKGVVTTGLTVKTERTKVAPKKSGVLAKGAKNITHKINTNEAKISTNGSATHKFNGDSKQIDEWEQL